MSPVLVATLGGILTALCWGTGNWLTGRSSKKADKYEILFAVQTPCALAAPLLLLIGDPGSFPNSTQLLTIFIYASLICLAFLLLVKALASGSVGIVVPLANSYPIFTLIFSGVFLGLVFTRMEIAAMLVIVAGALILAYEKNYKKIPTKVLYQESLLAVSAALCWGTAFFVINQLVGDVSWQMLMVVVSGMCALISIILLAMVSGSKIKDRAASAFKNRTAVVAGFIFTLGTIAFFASAEYAGSLIIPAVVGSTGPLVASVLSRIFDKEKIGLLKRIGAVLIVGGIVILNLA